MGPKRMPAVAGRFYPSDAESCAAMADALLRDVSSPAAVGAVVPHAGWVFSGGTAALGVAAIAASKPETVVIFGAVHTMDRNPASVYASGSWLTPLGELPVDEQLAGCFCTSPLLVDAPRAHNHEHAIEVQLPLLQRAMSNASIVPISVYPGPEAAGIGRFCAEQARKSGKRVAFLGSTDLTHYGPAFGFETQGSGAPGVRWAKDVNDRRFISLIEQMRADALVAESAIHRNACGAGAIAALVAAMSELSQTHYHELRHTCSADSEEIEDPDPLNSVGYEAGIFLPAA